MLPGSILFHLYNSLSIIFPFNFHGWDLALNKSRSSWNKTYQESPDFLVCYWSNVWASTALEAGLRFRVELTVARIRIRSFRKNRIRPSGKTESATPLGHWVKMRILKYIYSWRAFKSVLLEGVVHGELLQHLCLARLSANEPFIH